MRRGVLAVLLAAGLVAAATVVAGHVEGPPGGSGSAAPSGDDCRRPYDDTSPWNTPIPASPAIGPDSRRQVATIKGELTSDPTQYTYPVYEVSRSTRRIPVRVAGRFSDVASGTRLDIRDGTTIQMPLPDSARAARGSDAQVIVVDRDTGDEWGAWQLKRTDAGWQMQNGYHYNVRWSGVPPRDGAGRPFGSRGAGVPYLAGLVRPCELLRGRIDHALAFAYNWPSPEHVRPAAKSDGASGDANALPEGTRLQLDPGVPDELLQARGCNYECMVIARALKRYGMYVIDNAGRPKIMLEYNGTARWDGAIDAQTVSAIPLKTFRVVEDAASTGSQR